eukprot:CAMPEP_0175834266 /NCGR_PEP_ID=MMETSP0107_2-20121207/15968_1 /TAXON_ID=195067 ORGANISM="Goniomonas pacifica, Strain CCMP1869" /NCGR_SAMPLE_ID=MMETSP0107_2 /ASSEMBLY_ACC=CAM_ASM_000203 /LENGTH=331 /DNA_ID=CAMNT_0017147483 /DNA_START=620 /DNA_END=1615 /DNA_ORIENTATION=+
MTRRQRREHVVVHVLGGGITKIIQCGEWSTVSAMRREIGVPLDEVILLVPGHRELDDEMRLGEIVREGHLTVEVRCRGVGGGEAEDAALIQAADDEAAKEGNVDEIRRLLAAGANVNATDEDGKTPLHWSSTHGHVEVSQILLGAGANVHATDDTGATPLLESVVYVHLEVSQMLVRAGANVNAGDNEGWTPLHWAADRGCLGMTQMLLGEGASVHSSNDDGCTPLHCSAASGDVEVGQLLVGAGANVNAPDKREKTPLHWSADGGHFEVSQMLVGAGANVHAKDETGKIPIDLAKQPQLRGHGPSRGAVVALLQQESDPLTKSAAQGAAQ